MDGIGSPPLSQKELFMSLSELKNGLASKETVTIAAYHGEAPSHHLGIECVRWGNRNPSQMNDLLSLLPTESYTTLRSQLLGVSKDSGQPIRFIYL